MCVYFFNFNHLRIKLQISDLFWGTKFRALLFLSLHSSSSTFKLLFMTSYDGELLLDSSCTWSSVSIHLSPSPFHCNQTSRSKGIHWWRRSKAYKLHMELHHLGSFQRKILVWNFRQTVAIGNFPRILSDGNFVRNFQRTTKIYRLIFPMTIFSDGQKSDGNIHLTTDF